MTKNGLEDMLFCILGKNIKNSFDDVGFGVFLYGFSGIPVEKYVLLRFKCVLKQLVDLFG